MRAARVAISDALRADPAISALVDPSSIYAVERSVLPTLPAIETIGVTSERQDTGPMVRHELSVEITVSHASEDGADTLLDSIVRVTRSRLAAAAYQDNPITLADGRSVAIELCGTRWSVSAAGAAGVIRGAVGLRVRRGRR